MHFKITNLNEHLKQTKNSKKERNGQERQCSQKFFKPTSEQQHLILLETSCSMLGISGEHFHEDSCCCSDKHNSLSLTY